MKFAKIFLLVTVVATLSACGSSSKKGAWNDSDKKEATEFCNKEIGGQFPESMKKMIDMDKFCGCFTEKVEAEFDNFAAVKASDDKSAGEKIGRDCAMKSLNLGGAADEKAAPAEEAPATEEQK
ncbi:MAG: hypothetical protein KF690_09355 [Bacteroidetes bacterium]|nr:hypothetical protein [Bacteroidota bacterium]